MRKRIGWLGISVVSVAVACSGATELGEVDSNQDKSSEGDDNNANGNDEDSSSGSDGESSGGVTVSTSSGIGGWGSDGGEGTSDEVTSDAVTTVGFSSVGSTGSGSGGVGGSGEFECETVTTVSTSTDGAYSAVGTTSPCEGTTNGGWTGVGGSFGSASASVVTGAVTTVGTVGGTGGGGSEVTSCAPGEPECSGLCFGTSCEGQWECHAQANCGPGDVVAWCGCDGETFYALSGCPSRAFAHVGECE